MGSIGYKVQSSDLVHRDVKDENVVLGPAGKCILIDFGSSGLVKKHGWDTFSGTQVLIYYFRIRH